MLPGLPTAERVGMFSNTSQVIDDLHLIMSNLSSKTVAPDNFCVWITAKRGKDMVGGSVT